MGLGDMMGKAAGMLGGGDLDIGAKMEEFGIDPSMLENLDLEGAKAMLEEKGIDLGMLEGMGINLEDILAKFGGGDA